MLSFQHCDLWPIQAIRLLSSITRSLSARCCIWHLVCLARLRGVITPGPTRSATTFPMMASRKHAVYASYSKSSSRSRCSSLRRASARVMRFSAMISPSQSMPSPSTYTRPASSPWLGPSPHRSRSSTPLRTLRQLWAARCKCSYGQEWCGSRCTTMAPVRPKIVPLSVVPLFSSLSVWGLLSLALELRYAAWLELSGPSSEI
mmetsp:Transcript_4549/g.12063  ORF Transcript_4549/g.12063 Transcript_4549/m.12063 type:complete len:203 (+) Transcript_4549:723-1331(+)